MGERPRDTVGQLTTQALGPSLTLSICKIQMCAAGLCSQHWESRHSIPGFTSRPGQIGRSSKNKVESN